MKNFQKILSRHFNLLAIVALVIIAAVYVIWRNNLVSTNVPNVQTVSEYPSFSGNVTLGVGQTGKIDSLSITLNKISLDTRCAIINGKKCSPGSYPSLIVEATITDGTGSETVVLGNSYQKNQNILNHYISIVDVEPKPSEKKIPSGDYRVTFHSRLPIDCAFHYRASRPEIITKNGVTTYNHPDYGFQITYPSNLQASSTFIGAYHIDNGWRSGSYCKYSDAAVYSPGKESESGQEIISILIDSYETKRPIEEKKGEERDYFFYDAELTIGASDNVNEVKHCLDVNSYSNAAGTKDIDGIIFHKNTYEAAGMSQWAEVSSYVAVHNNICYAIESKLSGGSLGGGVPVAMEIKDQLTMDSIISSFKFAK